MVSIKTEQEIGIMAEGGKILAEIMKELKKKVKPGIKTKELERAAEALVFNCGARCSFKGFQGYPACLCVSINQEIVHALPTDRKLAEGDIVSLDLGILYKGFHTDMAITVPVGKVTEEAKKLIEATKEALRIGIKEIKIGNRFGDISRAIQKYVEGQGFGVVRELCGHGIGRELHEEPEILNAVSMEKTLVDEVKFTDDANIEIKQGMVFCVEPMVTAGDWHIKKGKDGFCFETKDGSLSAHFEHTIAITKDGVIVLTR